MHIGCISRAAATETQTLAGQLRIALRDFHRRSPRTNTPLSPFSTCSKPGRQLLADDGENATHHHFLGEKRRYSRHKQDEDESLVNGYKIIRPNGPVFGSRGKRQLMRTQSLGIDSLGQRSAVIVAHDVDDEPRQQQMQNYAVPAQNEANDSSMSLSEEDREPLADEVHASIEALCPDVTSLKQQDFDELVTKLLNSFNVVQLRSYLLLSLPAHDVHLKRDKSSDLSKTSLWQAYQSDGSLGKPHVPSMSKQGRKASFAGDIIRSVWKIMIEEEDMAIGEMELRLPAWQVRLMDRHVLQGEKMVPLWHTLLSSALLVRHVRITYQPQVVRIAARRRDAIQAANEILAKLEDAKLFDLQYTRMGPQIVKKIEQLSVTTLDNIAQQTNTSINVINAKKNGLLRISSLDEHHCTEAMRLIYRALDLQKMVTTNLWIDRHDKRISGRRDRLLQIPYFVKATMDDSDHLRLRSALPIKKNTTSERSVEHDADAIMSSLDPELSGSLQSAHSKIQQSAKHILPGPPPAIRWSVESGLVLKNPQDVDKETQDNVDIWSFAYETPNIASMIDVLEPMQVANSPSSANHMDALLASESLLVAQLVPRLDAMPHRRRNDMLDMPVGLELVFSTRSDHFRPYKVSLLGLRSILGIEHINLSLPRLTADLRIRGEISQWHNDSQVKEHMPELASFAAKLEAVTVEQSVDGLSSLDPTDAISIPVTGMADTLITLPYMVTHIERRHSMNFKMDSNAEPTAVQERQPDVRLNVLETDAGRYARPTRTITFCGSESGKSAALVTGVIDSLESQSSKPESRNTSKARNLVKPTATKKAGTEADAEHARVQLRPLLKSALHLMESALKPLTKRQEPAAPILGDRGRRSPPVTQNHVLSEHRSASESQSTLSDYGAREQQP